MYKKLIIFTLSILMVLLLSSCKEDSNLKTPSPVSTKRPVDTTNPLILSSIPLEKDTGKGWEPFSRLFIFRTGNKGDF